MLTLIEYGIGNIQSVVNALRRVGVDAAIARSGAELDEQNPAKIVMPGVGAVGEALENLRERGFVEVLEERVNQRKTPILGICVGLQVMAESCEEFGSHAGLGWIPGRVERLAPADATLRVPHVGWNTIETVAHDPILDSLDGEHFYFLHSYAMDCPAEYVTGRSEFGGPFVCAIRKDNISAVQFHPEKSSRAGERLLDAFVNG